MSNAETQAKSSTELGPDPADSRLPKMAFDVDQLLAAYDQWKCNCGPAAIAAVTQRTLLKVRNALDSLHRDGWPGYTTPADVCGVLRKLNCNHWAVRPKPTWPGCGLVKIQFGGPWMRDRLWGPPAVRSHWVAGMWGFGKCEASPLPEGEPKRHVILPAGDSAFLKLDARQQLIERLLRMDPGGIAGVPMLAGCGPAQECARRVKAYRAAHPSANWKEIFAAVPNHYCSPASLRQGMEAVAIRAAVRAVFK